MRPDDRDLDAELRGHLAISVKERVDRGEDPAAARFAALADLGYIPAIRDSIRRVWYSRWVEMADAFWQDLRIGMRSLLRTKGMAATVIVTLALGIGANAAIFSVVRGVLLRPLVNRDEDRLVFIRQSAPGLGSDNITFSVPEIADLKARTKTIAAFGDFSTIDFTLLGLGEPRMVKAGVVSGSYFEVMGLRPVVGRLLNETDDGPEAAGAAVLTYRFWSTALKSDRSLVGKTIELSTRPTTIVGVLEPSVPYPADTEIIANIVTSEHHLAATMLTGRTHRMTQLFGRLAPGASLDEARDDLSRVHTAMMREHPDAYPASAGVQLAVTPLRDQIAAPARTILLLLLGAAGIVFIIACSNVANLILARSVRREGELAVRAALGASRGTLRRALLAESLLLCGTGAAIGLILARPFVSVVAAFAARFSVRALDVTVDASLLWAGAALAIAAAVLLAYIPALPGKDLGRARGRGQTPNYRGLTPIAEVVSQGATRRLRLFAIVQIACSFALLAAAGTLLATLLSLQKADTGYDLEHVLAIDVPMPALAQSTAQQIEIYREMTRRIGALPDVTDVALGTFVPWRDAGSLGPGFTFTTDGSTPAPGEDQPRGRLRAVSPGFFKALGVPLIEGREFTPDDRTGNDPVVIVSQSVARRLFPDCDALNRTMTWTDPLFGKPVPRRIVGIVADVDDEHVVREPSLTIYHPVEQLRIAGRLFVRAAGDPYELVSPIAQIVHELSANQPVEHATTLGDVRAEVLAPERLQALVVSVFAAIAVLIAVVGVAGVLAFGVTARTHEFGVRIAMGSTRRQVLGQVLGEGVLIVAMGIVAGAAAGYAFAGIATALFGHVELPHVLPMMAAAILLGGAAVAASLIPAARASRVDVLGALRTE